jgi:hypothetical protein
MSWSWGDQGYRRRHQREQNDGAGVVVVVDGEVLLVDWVQEC